MLEDAAPRSVSIEELRFASGIHEFARRVRELREEGYDIQSTGEGYLLISPTFNDRSR
jgi:biotin operon repressor